MKILIRIFVGHCLRLWFKNETETKEKNSNILYYIMKTCLYSFDPLKHHLYIIKLGFTGVYIIFLISAKNIDCGYSLGPPRRGSSNEYPQAMF